MKLEIETNLKKKKKKEKLLLYNYLLPKYHYFILFYISFIPLIPHIDF